MCPCGTKALSGVKAIFTSLQCVHVGTRALSENSLCVYVGTRTLSEKVGQKNGLIFVIRRCRGANEFIIVYNCLACQYPSSRSLNSTLVGAKFLMCLCGTRTLSGDRRQRR